MLNLTLIAIKGFTVVSGPVESALQCKNKFTKIQVPGGPLRGPQTLLGTDNARV